MLHYLPNNAETAKLLQAALRILSDPEKWCKGDMQRGSAYCINGALYAAGMPNNPIPEEQFSADPRYTWDDIKHGDLQESFGFQDKPSNCVLIIGVLAGLVTLLPQSIIRLLP